MTNFNKVLIDSHVLIWLLYEPEKLSPKAKDLLLEAEEVLLSVVSLWELALKFNAQKLAYSPEELIEGAKELNLSNMPLESKHIPTISSIRLRHKDPFDILLIAQSEIENCIFLTADKNILSSDYRIFKC